MHRQRSPERGVALGALAVSLFVGFGGHRAVGRLVAGLAQTRVVSVVPGVWAHRPVADTLDGAQGQVDPDE